MGLSKPSFPTFLQHLPFPHNLPIFAFSGFTSSHFIPLLVLLVIIDLLVPAASSLARFHLRLHHLPLFSFIFHSAPSASTFPLHLPLRAPHPSRLSSGWHLQKSLQILRLTLLQHSGRLWFSHLISITPKEVLGSKILVRVLRSLLQGLHMLPMTPMLIPQVIRVGARNQQARNRHTTNSQLLPSSRSPFARGSSLDGKFAPEIYHPVSFLPFTQSEAYHKPEVAAA